LRRWRFAASLAALTMMQAIAPSRHHAEAHLWMIALGLSLLANVGVLALVGMASLKFETLRKQSPPPPEPAAETVATIYAAPAAPAEAQAAPQGVPLAEKRFARTSPDQAAPLEKNTAFIGERNTRAVSDRTPVPAAPPLPSQAGITPRDETDIETTESDYQDGGLSAESPAPLEPAAAAAKAAPETAAQDPRPAAAASLPPPREKLLEGPNPVDVPVPRKTAAGEEIKPTPEPRPAAGTPPAPVLSKTADVPKPKSSKEPAFKGFQRKTAVVGSISRTGKSSLDVEDSALGRYQAAISRAVELEWQRNCVRHRDFITPGFLTVRFFVEPGGKVRSVQFVGDMETGEVQKGFTLNSIRDAEIPAMPATLRREYDEEPLELVFRFYF
jgi:hypothetical protein